MKIIFLLLMLLSSFVDWGQGCCDMQPESIVSIERLSVEYQRLKKNPDRDCCNNYGSGLMDVMEILSDSIAVGSSEKRIIEIMGQPDMFADKNHPIEHHFIQPAEGELILVYHWRGMHDFLYFVIQDNYLVLKNWYYAWE
jgi:hypothetical protein